MFPRRIVSKNPYLPFNMGETKSYQSFQLISSKHNPCTRAIYEQSIKSCSHRPGESPEAASGTITSLLSDELQLTDLLNDQSIRSCERIIRTHPALSNKAFAATSTERGLSENICSACHPLGASKLQHNLADVFARCWNSAWTMEGFSTLQWGVISSEMVAMCYYRSGFH